MAMSRDLLHVGVEVFLEAMFDARRSRREPAVKRKPTPPPEAPSNPDRPTRVVWVGSTLGQALAARVGRIVLTVQDARHGVEVVEVVSWSPRSRDAALGRVERVLGAEQLRGCATYVGEVVR